MHLYLACIRMHLCLALDLMHLRLWMRLCLAVALMYLRLCLACVMHLRLT